MQVKPTVKSESPGCHGQTAWFIGRLLFEVVPSAGSRKPSANTTLVLVSAVDPEQAIDKLVAIGQSSEGPCRSPSEEPCVARFRGLLDLVPIYEPIEDGCELLDEGETDASHIHSPVLSKAELLSEINKIEEMRRDFGCMPMWGSPASSKGTHVADPFREQ